MSIFAAANISEWRGVEVVEEVFLNSMASIATNDLIGGPLVWRDYGFS